MEVSVERRDCATMGLAREAFEAFGPWLEKLGPIAIVDLETTGLPERRSSEMIEIGILLLDPGEESIGVATTFVRPSRPIPPLISRLTGLVDADVEDAPHLVGIRDSIRLLLAGRSIVAHQAEFERNFLRRDIHSTLGHARYLDSQDILALTHPDSPDLRLETFTRRMLGREERHRALDDAIDLLCVLGEIAKGVVAGESRYREATRIAERHLRNSPWYGLLTAHGASSSSGSTSFMDAASNLGAAADLGAASNLGAAADSEPVGDDDDFDFIAFTKGLSKGTQSEPAATSESSELIEAGDPAYGFRRGEDPKAAVDARFLEIGPSDEEPVPFELDAILAAVGDAERGARHFPGYRVREEQLALVREFVHVFEEGGVAKLEGGTGVGKSLAYLAVAIPFAMSKAASKSTAGERAEGEDGGGRPEPVILSTRTKLLQDQLLHKDIAAAARFMGYPNLRALSIKGRANYVCERRLTASLSGADDPALLDEFRMDYALLESCARIRPNGEVGTVPTALLRRNPKLRELLRSSVATRADQCSREQCGHEKACPFGRHRRSLARAHLVVANHDLLLRWPPDYPSFSYVVMDEGHEVGGVAEEVYALRVRPEDVGERLDELFGAPVRGGQSRAGSRFASRGLVASPKTRQDEDILRQNRRDLMLELVGLGRTIADQADAFGGVELSTDPGQRHPTAAQLSESAAVRLEALAAYAEREGPTKRLEAGEDRDGLPTTPQRDLDAEEEVKRAISSHTEALLGAAHGLRTAFGADNDDYVGAFEGLESPYDRWSLVLRPVAPGESFRNEFLGRVEGLAVVSATLFVGGDDHAALGEVGLSGNEVEASWSHTVGSPFPYETAMRVVAIESDSELVEETAQTLAVLARRLGGRTLGLFTSLARMRETADRLTSLLEGEGIEVLMPRRSSDDPASLVERFRNAKGGAVLLGARRFWQGIDVRGADLEAVVIEKLPFEVPTELRRRRDDRLRAAGGDPFTRSSLGRMLLHLKQMSGRLIRSETDRGMVVIIDARHDRGYFRRLPDALPDGVRIEVLPRDALPKVADELGLGQ